MSLVDWRKTFAVESNTYDGSLALSETMTGEVSGSVVRTYDANLRVNSESVNSETPMEVSYNKDGQLLTMGDTAVSRDPQTGSVATNTYNTLGELEQLAYGVSYIRDELGRIQVKTETLDDTVSVRCYAYDETSRLVEVRNAYNEASKSCEGTQVEAYGYDGNSNRRYALNQAGEVEDADILVDDQDRLLEYGDFDFSYTANGELETMENVSTSESWVFDYDVRSNLRQVELPDGTDIEYVIDARDRRVGKKVDGALVQGFVYRDQLNPVAELDANGDVVSRFVYGSRGHVPDYMVKGENTYRVISDYLGSVIAVVNVATGEMVQRMEYDAWGRVLEDTNPGFQPFGFAGGIYDRDTELVRFGARDYDAARGRWTSKDPIGFAGGDSNLFVYVGARVADRTDRSGTEAGDPFSSIRDALMDFCETYGPETLSGGPEYTTAAIQECEELAEGQYGPQYCYLTYRTPTPGKNHDVVAFPFLEDLAQCHSHPSGFPEPTDPEDYDQCRTDLCGLCNGRNLSVYRSRKKILESRRGGR